MSRLGVGRGDRVLVAVSGGPDSSALLLLLCGAAASLGYACEGAYFDHQIRAGAERAAERATVERLTEGIGVALRIGAAPVRALAREHGRSVEDEARVQRYRFLANTAAECGAAFVATGHTADDEVETILLHLLRGSGVHGLAGMRERSAWPFGPGPALLRPLLDLSKAETAAYVRSRGITAHDDSENGSPRYLRNRVRSELLPVLESLNPRARHAILRLGRAATAQLELLQALAAREGAGAAAGTTPPTLNAAVLTSLPEAVRTELLVQGFAGATGSRAGLTARHLAALAALLQAHGDRAIDLPSGVRARVSAGRLWFESASAPEVEAAMPSEMPMSLSGPVRFGDWVFEARPVPPGTSCCPSPLRAVLAASTAEAGLMLRTRRPGDRIRLDGGRGHQKVQDVLVDAKLARSRRDALPLLCIGDEVVWAPGIRAEERARTRDASLQRISIVATRLDAGVAGGLGSEEQTE